MSKSVVAAYNAYPLTNENKCNNEINARRLGFQQGYEQAEKEYKNQWISVEEALPEEHGIYFVLINSKAPHITTFTDKWNIGNNTYNITHWMPIPEMKGGMRYERNQ